MNVSGTVHKKIKKLLFQNIDCVSCIRNSSAGMLFALCLVLSSHAQTYKFNFGTAASPVVSGYTKVTTGNLYTKAYTTDNVIGYYGFENWKNTQFGISDRGGNDSLHRGVASSKNKPFYFSVNVAEGKYLVTVAIGDLVDTATTTIRAEDRRLFVDKLHTEAGQIISRSFIVMRRDPQISASQSVAVDTKYGREAPQTCLGWDRKLTFEINGSRPCISTIEITKVDTGVTVHLCGNSTLTEQTDEPWSAWGQMAPKFFSSSVVFNNLANSGNTAQGFLANKRLTKICSVMKESDYLLVEFGHNDSKDSTAKINFKSNLKVFRDSAVAHKATCVFVTPVARESDSDTATSIGGFADSMRACAKVLNVAMIDLNAIAIRMNKAFGSGGAAMHLHYARGVWADTTTMKDGTHFCPFGAYEIARAVIQYGLKRSGLALYNYVLDTAEFNPDKPDNPASFSLPGSIDTADRHPSAVVSIRSLDQEVVIHSEAAELAIDKSFTHIQFKIDFQGIAQFEVLSTNGKKLLHREREMNDRNGTFEWKELSQLPKGNYILHMKNNETIYGKIKFCKM